MSVYRYPWKKFPPLIIHAEESDVKKHPAYPAAKAGDPASAFNLVSQMISDICLSQLCQLFSEKNPVLVSAHAVETSGVNAIPQAMAEYLGKKLRWPVESSIVQTNVVGHTGADGFSRLARQAEFDGRVSKNAWYILVDDFIGQGGTLANLRGFLLHNRAQVIGGTVLTGKPYSANLSSDEQQIIHLREKHGTELESWWSNHFGFGYDCLTRSEARYLLNTPAAQRIRNKIAQASETGNFPTRGKVSPGELNT
jgi:adenine/guanine phosphoribosyltransferase-like PRPP-binding protein